ncbi:MAG: hypothetical protein ACR2PT_09680 [Endozoicomonas sp.]
MKRHSPAGKTVLFCVLSLLVVISVMQASTSSARLNGVRVETRTMLDVRAPQPAGSKKPDARAEHYFCKELPLLHWATSVTGGNFSFPPDFQLVNSNEGPLLAELKNAGERQWVNIYSGEAEVEISLLGAESANLHCKLVKDCTQEMLDVVIEGGAACLFIVRDKSGRRANLYKPTVLRLVPPEEKKTAGGSPVMVTSGGILGGVPPGGPGRGSPGMMEIFSYTTVNDWFAQEMARLLPTRPTRTFMGATPTGAQWQRIRSGRWYQAVSLDSNCQVNGRVPSAPGQLSQCDLFLQMAAAVALLAQMSPGFFTYMDQTSDGKPKPQGSDSSTGDKTAEKTGDQNARQEREDSPSDKKDGQQTPPPPPGGAMPQLSGQTSINDILAAAYQAVVDSLRTGSGISDQLMTMVNGNPAIRAMLLTLGTIEQEGAGSDGLRSEQVIDLFETTEADKASQQHGLVATWLLYQLGLQNQQASPWQWVLQQVNHPRATNLTGSIEQLFLDGLKRWFNLQVAGRESAAQAAIHKSGYEGVEAFTRSWSFAGVVDQVYAITSQLDGTAIEEAGPVWLPLPARGVPDAPVRPDQSPAQRVVRLEGLVEPIENPHGRPMAAVTPIRIQPRAAPVQAPPPTATSGNPHSGWLRSLNTYQDPQLQKLTELTGDLYGTSVITHAQYESVLSAVTAGEQAQALLGILATTSEENLRLVVQKIDGAEGTVLSSLASFRAELGRRLGMPEPRAESQVDRREAGAASTFSTSDPNLGNEDLNEHYLRAVGKYPNLKNFSGRQNVDALRKAHADMIRKLSTVARRIADLLKQAAWLTEHEYQTVLSERTGSGMIGKILDGLRRREEKYHFPVWIGLLLQLVGDNELGLDRVNGFVRKAEGQ